MAGGGWDNGAPKRGVENWMGCILLQPCIKEGELMTVRLKRGRDLDECDMIWDDMV